MCYRLAKKNVNWESNDALNSTLITAKQKYFENVIAKNRPKGFQLQFNGNYLIQHMRIWSLFRSIQI